MSECVLGSWCEFTKHMSLMLMKSERRWDAHRANDLSGIVLPFGKHAGMEIGDVPLKYLDETISVMPTTWFVRRVMEFVDLVMDHEFISGGCPNKTPNASYRQLEEEWRLEEESMLEAMDAANRTT